MGEENKKNFQLAIGIFSPEEALALIEDGCYPLVVLSDGEFEPEAYTELGPDNKFGIAVSGDQRVSIYEATSSEHITALVYHDETKVVLSSEEIDYVATYYLADGSTVTLNELIAEQLAALDTFSRGF